MRLPWFWLLPPPPPAAAGDVVLKAARLWDGRGGPAISPGFVRVSGDRILEIGARPSVPPRVPLLDLRDATLLPLLLPLHSLLTDRFGVHWEDALLTTTPPEAALWGAHNARTTLLAGFTTCRDMGPTWPSA